MIEPNSVPEKSLPEQVAESRTTLREAQERLDRLEAKTIAGARVLTPKQKLLDISELQEKNPGKHFRWINLRDKNKADARIASGYVRVPEAQGGRHLGDETAIFELPRGEAEARHAAISRKNEEWSQAHVREMENAVDSVARQMRDKYGLKYNVDRLMVRE